jgi:hypothetical protein
VTSTAIGYPSSPVCPLVHALTSITTPSWRPHHIDAEAVGGLTSDQVAIPGIHRLKCAVRPSPQEVGWLLDGSQIAALQPSQPPGTEHDRSRHITSSHHTTTSPHHSVSSVSNPVEHVCFASWAGGAEYKYKYNPK